MFASDAFALVSVEVLELLHAVSTDLTMVWVLVKVLELYVT